MFPTALELNLPASPNRVRLHFESRINCELDGRLIMALHLGRAVLLLRTYGPNTLASAFNFLNALLQSLGLHTPSIRWNESNTENRLEVRIDTVIARPPKSSLSASNNDSTWVSVSLGLEYSARRCTGYWPDAYVLRP